MFMKVVTMLKMNHQFVSEIKRRLIQNVAKNTLRRMLHSKTESKVKPAEKHQACYDKPTKVLLKINMATDFEPFLEIINQFREHP